MTPYIQRAATRVGRALLTIFLVYVFVFVLLVVVPGNPIANRLSNPDLGYTEEDIEQLVAYYGLDRPLPEQFLALFLNALRGDFGLSLTSTRPVGDIIAQAFPSTLVLSLTALGFAVLIALGIAYATYRFRGVLTDAFRNLPALFHSVPNFLISLFFIQIFAFKFGLFRVMDPEGFVATIFAALVLALPLSASIAQVLIAGIDDIKEQAFVDVASSKSLSKGAIFIHHLLRPASLPALTILGLLVGEVLGGSIIVESVFGRDGLGSVVQDAVVSQDTPVLLAVSVLSAVVFVAVNLLVDLIYPLVDPRLRVRHSEQSPVKVGVSA